FGNEPTPQSPDDTSEPNPRLRARTTPQSPDPTRELTQTHPHSPFLGPKRCFRVISRWAGRPSGGWIGPHKDGRVAPHIGGRPLTPGSWARATSHQAVRSQ